MEHSAFLRFVCHLAASSSGTFIRLLLFNVQRQALCRFNRHTAHSIAPRCEWDFKSHIGSKVLSVYARQSPRCPATYPKSKVLRERGDLSLRLPLPVASSLSEKRKTRYSSYLSLLGENCNATAYIPHPFIAEQTLTALVTPPIWRQTARDIRIIAESRLGQLRGASEPQRDGCLNNHCHNH
ncbi:hypothetical protein BDW75DRAFT_34087 [Aspergillus navahoensis]